MSPLRNKLSLTDFFSSEESGVKKTARVVSGAEEAKFKQARSLYLGNNLPS